MYSACRVPDSFDARRIERERESILNIDGKIEANKGSLQATYINQLKCIHQLTDAGAVGIARRYPSWSRLLQAYRNCRTLQEKYDLLEDIPVSLFSVFE